MQRDYVVGSGDDRSGRSVVGSCGPDFDRTSAVKKLSTTLRSSLVLHLGVASLHLRLVSLHVEVVSLHLGIVWLYT